MYANKIFLLMAFFFLPVGFSKQVFLFKGEKLKGGSFQLQESLQKGKYTFLSFWASWCGPCIQELKQVSDGLKQNTSLPLEVVAVNIDTPEQKSVVKSLVKQMGFDFNIILDPSMNIFSKFQADPALPLSYLVSPEGRIVKTYKAYHDKIFEEVSKLVLDAK